MNPFDLFSFNAEINRLFAVSIRCAEHGHFGWAVRLEEQARTELKRARHQLWFNERGRF